MARGARRVVAPRKGKASTQAVQRTLTTSEDSDGSVVMGLKRTSERSSPEDQTVNQPMKQARVDPEPKEVTIIFRKLKVQSSSLRFELDQLTEKWEAFQADPAESRKQSLHCGLDDARQSLDGLMAIRNDCCEILEIDDSDTRLVKLEEDILQFRMEFGKLQDAVLAVKTSGAMDEDSQPSVVGSAKGPASLPVYYPHYDPKKDGIVFSGTSSKDYASFLIGWKTVEGEFEMRNKPKIELFRQLKKCLSGDPRDLIKDLPETDTAVEYAFQILDKYYKRPLEGIIATYKAVAMTGKGSCKYSHGSCWDLYKKYLAVEQTRSLFNLDSETEASLLMMAQACLTFNTEMENKFKKYMLEHCHDPSEKLQYKVGRNTVADFLQYILHTTEKTDGSELKKPADDKREKQEKRSASASFATDSKDCCCFCGLTNHSTFKCLKLKRLPADQQLRFSRVKHLCQACFLPFKKGHKCDTKCSISECSGRHLTRLHDVVQREDKTDGGFRTTDSWQQKTVPSHSSKDAGQKPNTTWKKPVSQSPGTSQAAKEARNQQ